MSPVRLLRERYGAGPAHLIGGLLVLVLGVYALTRFLSAGPVLDLVLWILGAVLLHDLVLLPAYTALDRALQGATRRVPRLLNHLRVPTVLSGLVFLVYFPLILALRPELFRATTGLGTGPYLGRWLLITAGLFLVSALVFVVRLVRERRA
jgi:hypothetical protein